MLLPPPLESLHCGLPSPEWPSDHISLLANFTIDFHTEGIAASKSAFASEANGGAEAVKHIRFSGQLLLGYTVVCSDFEEHFKSNNSAEVNNLSTSLV